MDNEVIFDGEALFQFLEDVLTYYRIVKENPNYTKEQFLDWLVIRAAHVSSHRMLCTSAVPHLVLIDRSRHRLAVHPGEIDAGEAGGAHDCSLAES